MLASCRRSRVAPRREKKPGFLASVPDSPFAGASVVIGSLRLLQDLLLFRVPFETGLRLQVLARVLLRNEHEAGVRICRTRESSGDLVQVELHHRVEALHIGLLVYREVDVAGLYELERLRQEIVPAATHPLLVQAVLLHHLGDTLGAAGVHGEHALHVLVALVVRVDPVQLVRNLGASCDLRILDVRTRVLYGLDGAVDARLDVERARRRDEERYRPFPHQVHDPLAHLHPGEEEILADVRERGVVLTFLAICIVRNDGDALVQSLLDRAVEGLRVYDGERDAVGVPRDRRAHGINHLLDVRLLRTRPLGLGTKQRVRVLDAVLGGNEERVGGHVVDEYEVVLGGLGEVPGSPTTGLLGRLAPAPAQEQASRRQRTRRQKLPPTQPVAPVAAGPKLVHPYPPPCPSSCPCKILSYQSKSVSSARRASYWGLSTSSHHRPIRAVVPPST